MHGFLSLSTFFFVRLVFALLSTIGVFSRALPGDRKHKKLKVLGILLEVGYSEESNMQQVFHLSPQPLATATAWRFVLCCCMIALFTHAAMADSPCDIVQVFPVHEVGLGAAEDIRLSLSSMPTGMSYYLDGKLCTASDTFTLKCSVQPLDDDEGLFALLASNGSMPFILTTVYFGATSWCYLNHTSDGTLLRQAYLTPIVLSTKVVTPFLPQPIMHVRWAASSGLFSIMNNTTVTTVPVIYVSNGAVLQLSSVSAVGTVAAQPGFSIYSSVATFPTFLDGAHHALWNITLRIQTGQGGRWVEGVVASAAKYARTLVEYEQDWSVVNSFHHSRGNVSGNDGLTWTHAFGAVVPVIFNVSVSAASSIVTPQVSSADASSSSSFSPLVQVTIHGAFPACSTDLCRRPDVTLTHLFHQTAVRCRITSINSSAILCFANLTVNQSNVGTAAPLPLGLGFASVIVNSTVPSLFEEIVVPINVASVAGGWLSLGPLTRAVIVMIPNDAANENGTIYGESDDQRRQHVIRVHCASSAAMEVRNSATGEVICSVSNDSRIGANASRVIALEHANEQSRIVLDSSCCSVDSSSSGRCATGSLCAVSLEHMNISSASQEQQHLVAVVLIEVDSAVDFTNHTIVSTSSRFLHRRIGEVLAAPFVFLPIADGSIVLQVPAAIDNETHCKQSLISIAQGSQATVTSMWGRFSPNLNGTWRNGTLRCSWHVVFPLTSCAPFRTQGNATQGSTNSMEATVLFCGPRRAFEDPIPYTRMEIPSDALQKVDVMASNTWVPRVVFPGFPPASSTVLVATENGTTNKTSVASVTTDASQLQHVLAAVSPTQAAGGATVSILVGFNGSSSQVNVTGVGITTSRISSDVNVLDAIVWMIISGKQACSQSGASSSAFGSWDVCTNITVIVPTGGAPSGFYRVVVLLDAGGTVTIPSDATILKQATSSMFFFVKATVTSVSSDTVGAVGGGTFTMQGRNFPLKGAAGGQLSMSVFGDATNAFVPSVLLLGSDVFLSWTTGNLINITGPRTLNTVQGNWTMCVVVAIATDDSGNTTSSFCAQTINGTIPIYQPAALPRITEVAPLTLSSASDFVLTVQGTSLSLREISVCPEADVSSTVTTPYFLRDVEACEWCVPSFSNATRVECVVSRAVRHGAYGVYLSSPTAGAAVSTGITPLQFSFAITAVYPPDVSAFGSAALTITGVSLTSEWVYRLWEPILNQYVDCANVTMVADTLILCSLPAFYTGAVSQGVPYELVAQHRVLGSTIQCATSATTTLGSSSSSSFSPEGLPSFSSAGCTVTFGADLLPTFVSVTPIQGQAPLSVTVYGTKFTGNATWVLPNATNVQLFIGSAPCLISLPIYFDRIICSLQSPCSTSSGSNHNDDAQIHAIVTPYGRTSSTFNAPTRFSCTMSVLSIAPTSGSTMGGQQVTIQGIGFPTTSAPPTVAVGGIGCIPSNYNGTTIVCRTQSVGEVTDLRGEVRVSSSIDPTLYASCCTYLYSAALTPQVDSIAPTTGSEGVRATVVGSKFTTGVQVEMSGIIITDAVVLSSTSVNLLIPRLPPAATRLRLSISGIGYAFHSSTLENFTYALSISRVTPARGSFQSGLLMTIVGSGLGINASTITAGTMILQQPTTKVFVCGRLCSTTLLDFSSLTCAIPEYMDTYMMQLYPSSVQVRNLTATNFTVYQRIAANATAAVSWVDVTTMFSGGDEPTDGTGLTASRSTEEFLIAANKHSRLALTRASLLVKGIRNTSQNVTCTMRKVLATSLPATTMSTLQGSPTTDWSGNSTMWSSTNSWAAMGMGNGWTSTDLATLFDTGRFFLLRCERLVAGETTLLGARISGTVVGLTAVGGVCPINIVVTSAQQVYESCSDVLGASCTTFVYDSTLTPIVLGYSVPYSPNTIATRVTLSGSGFGLAADSVSNIGIGGLNCLIQLAQESTLVCVTQGRLRSPIVGNQGISIVGKGLGRMIAPVPFLGTEPWSSPGSWYQSEVPGPLSIVYIPNGISILLDGSPNTLTAIIVAGTLILQDIPMDVRTCLIVVLAGGTLQGGNPTSPLASAVNLTFVSNEYLAWAPADDVTNGQLPSYVPGGRSVHKALLVLGGTLRLYGTLDTVVSSYLQQTAYAGNRTITIQDRVAWIVGAEILIASVTPDITESEERFIVSKTLVGNTAILDLDQPLHYTHARSTDTYLGNTFELTARVMTQTRNVVIRSDNVSETTLEGVAIVVEKDSQVTLSSVRLSRCGKAARFGEHSGAPAIEFRSVRFQEPIVVMTQCVLRRSYHRGIVFRNTRLLSITSTVVSQTNGHGVAALDGSNVNLTLSSMIVCRSEFPATEPGADPFPANFYLTSPLVSIINNFAFGSTGDNIWLHWTDDQFSSPNPLCPSQRAMISFSGNAICGAQRDGVRITDAWLARALPCVDRQLGISTSNPFVSSLLVQTLIFACKGNGFFIGVVGSVVISSGYVIDVLMSGINIGSSGGGAVTITGTMISGLLASGGTLLRNTPTNARNGLWIRGNALSFTITSLHIRNATGTSIRVCPVVAAEAPPNDMPAFLSSSKITITGTNLTTQVALCGSVVIQDNDGSLTQVQREVYLIANHRGALDPAAFTMCRTFQDAAGDLSSAIAASIVDGYTGSNATMLLCDTYSTYLFFAVTLTFRGTTAAMPVLPKVLHVHVFQDSTLITSFNISFVESPSDAKRFRYANLRTTSTSTNDNNMSETQATFLVVDGRPSTVTATATIFSSRLQFLLAPLCESSSNHSVLVRCTLLEPQEIFLSRVGASIPNFPSQFLVDARSSSLYAINVSSLSPQFSLRASSSWVYAQWLTTVASVVNLRNTLVSDSVQGTLIRRRDTAAVNVTGTSSALVSLWFSTTTTAEAIGVGLAYCSSGMWCIPGASYPTNASSGVTTVSTTWNSTTSWRSSAPPTSDTTVAVIPQGVVVTLNTAVSFPLQALVVMGTLIIDGSVNNITLRVTQLIVLGTLQINARSSTSSVIISLLTGLENISEMSTMMCGVNPLAELMLTPALGIPCGTVYTAGSLTSNGAPRHTWWTQSNSATAGSQTFGLPPTSSVLGQLQEGWRVGLTSSDPQYPQGEQNIVADASNGGVQTPWGFSHRATLVLSGGVYRFPEAVNFAKTVAFQCGGASLYGNGWNRTLGSAAGGCRFVVHRHRDLTAISALMNGVNSVLLSHSMVEGFGFTRIPSATDYESSGNSSLNSTSESFVWQGRLDPTTTNNTSSGSVTSYLDLYTSGWTAIAASGAPALWISGTATNVTITHSLVVNSSNMAVLVSPASSTSTSNNNASTVLLDNSVVWNCNGTGIALSGTTAVLSNVLVAGVAYARRDDGVIASNASLPLCSILDISGANRLTTVIAAGSEAEGICLPWNGCSMTLHTGVTAHSCANGVFLFEACDLLPTAGVNCTLASSLTNKSVACLADQALSNVVVYRNSFIGLQSSQHAQLSLVSLISAHNPVGVYTTSRTGVSGPTRITTSYFTNVDTTEDCANVICSSSFAFQSEVDCTTVLFTSAFQVAAILLAPSSMGGISITYDRSGFPITGVIQREWARLSIALNASASSTVTLTGNSFSNFQSCGVALAFNPLALATDAPYVVASSFRYDTTLNMVFLPTSTYALPGRENGSPCTSVSGACTPYQPVMIVDSDGSIRGANATSLIVMTQSGTGLVSCSSTAYGLDVCPTTLPFGRLIIESPQDSTALTLQCIASRANYGTVVPGFLGCNMLETKPWDLVPRPPDPIMTLLTLTGVYITLSSSVIPRRLKFTLAQCTTSDTSSVVLTIMQLEVTAVRTSVWVDGALRQMGIAEPSLTSRNGEWYRNPIVIGDDVEGDSRDWSALALTCGSSVDMHQVVRGVVTLVMNTSAGLITFGYRQQLSAQIATIADRPATTVFVASAAPTDPPTQSTVVIYLEAEDTVDYNATNEGQLINAALQRVKSLTPQMLTSNLGLVVFSVTTTPVIFEFASEPAPTSLFTLGNIIVFCGAAGALIGIAVCFYWYLLALRISVTRAAKRTYDGITFERDVEELPPTDDVDDDFGIEETVPETSHDARLIAYLEDWKIPLSKPIFADVTLLASSAQTSPNSSASDRPLAPPVNGGGMESFRTREGGSVGGSIINAFLQMNSNDTRLRSPRQSSAIPPTASATHAALHSSQRRTSLQSFQLDPGPFIVVPRSSDAYHTDDDDDDAEKPVKVQPHDDEPAPRCPSTPTIGSGSRESEERAAVIVTPILMSPPSTHPQDLFIGTPKPQSHLTANLVVGSGPSSATHTPMATDVMTHSARRRVSFTFGAPTPPTAAPPPAAELATHKSTVLPRTASHSRPPPTPRSSMRDEPLAHVSVMSSSHTPLEQQPILRLSPDHPEKKQDSTSLRSEADSAPVPLTMPPIAPQPRQQPNIPQSPGEDPQQQQQPKPARRSRFTSSQVKFQ